MNETYIYFLESEEETPRVVGYKTWHTDIYELNDVQKEGEPRKVSTYYELYIPEGSIVQSFELN